MAASGRYQSRLLNYLVERSQKLGEQASYRLRQARTGAVWGAQLLIYPLYVAFQASRVVGRRLSQGGPMPGQARLIPPRADDVISTVLKLARNLADEGAITIGPESSSLSGAVPATASLNHPPNSPEASLNTASSAGHGVSIAIAPNPPQNFSRASLKSASPDGANPIFGGVDIRGVASELGNRALVLVDNSNRTVPLESEQQWTLQQTIVQQVADFNYRRQRYGQQLALVEAGDLPLPLPQPRAKQLAGFRWMTHLMGWMQTGDLAQSTNLFQESQLATQLAAQVAAPPFLYWDPEPGQQLTRQTLAQLDAPLAGLEQRYIQRDGRDDAATKALRFTAKLFGLEEAADQWLRASAASRAAENSSTPQNAQGLSPQQSTGKIPSGQMPGRLHPAWSSADPWGDYRGQLPGQAPQGLEPLPASAAQNPSQVQGNLPPAPAPAQLKNSQGWLSGLLNPSSAAVPAQENAPANLAANLAQTDASPKGWQRLTTRFGGLLRNLQSPAGPIAPLKPQGPKPFTPAAAAPTNASLGQPGQNDGMSAALNASSSNAATQGNLAQAGLSDPQIEAAWQKRLANARAIAEGAKSKNVTLRSQPAGAQAVTQSATQQVPPEKSISEEPNALQTAETAVTYESPYIETTAQFNGYEKHPLEVVLDQVDRILLWIEERGLELWRWLTNAGEQ